MHRPAPNDKIIAATQSGQRCSGEAGLFEENQLGQPSLKHSASVDLNAVSPAEKRQTEKGAEGPEKPWSSEEKHLRLCESIKKNKNGLFFLSSYSIWMI